MRIVPVAIACLVCHAAFAAAQTSDVQHLIASAPFEQASVFIRSDQGRFVRELIALTEIPSPPFKERARAEAFLAMLRESGLSDVEMDPEGNVMGIRKGRGGAPLLAVVAHMDTVFPEGTDVTVKREGTRLAAPGVGDDTRGLALMLAVIRAMNAGHVETDGDILFVGGVGEEGQGDLRGVKYLLREGRYKDRIRRFLAIDGGDQAHLTRGGVGSKRYRAIFTGPGGHSYGAFGLVNPAFAMGNAIAQFSRVHVPATPKTTFSVGVVRGGTSVNSIPAEVSMDVDMRSVDCGELKNVDDQFLGILRAAVEEENRMRSTRQGRVDVDPKIIGERPCGETSLDAPIVRRSAAVLEAFGLKPTYGISSTDSNIAMSLGIPALTIGHGGDGGRSHSPDEWTDVDRAKNVEAVRIALAIIVSAAR